MAKKFNVTGLCFPEDHYMADVSKKMDATYKMIEEGEYFTINRPRQYGKTTTIYTLAKRLRASNYIVFSISFEGISEHSFDNEGTLSKAFLNLLVKSSRIHHKDTTATLEEMATTVTSLDDLANMITKFMVSLDKKVIVIIDEVDKSSNNQLFVSFLAMLRNKYLDRKDEPTFHSIVLAGVHDVKTLKLKIRAGEEQKYNSPWNIAADFNVNMNLLPDEIKPMLDDYCQEQTVIMDTQAIAEYLFYFTSGYPFLVSQMCKIIHEEVLPAKPTKEWTKEDVNKAFQIILRKPNITNFDTLMKNLFDDDDLYQLVFLIVIDGAKIEYRLDDPIINWGSLNGIFAASEEGMLRIHNRIYRERIANMMISRWRTTNLIKGETNINTDVFDYTSQYRLPNNGLDMHKVLLNFQAFMKQHYSAKNRRFLERDGRLIFLSFMRPIINGAGYDFKEPQVSQEKRIDVVITYYQHQYVAELKIWHGDTAHEKGLKQLADYLERLGLSTGFLLIFDHSQRKKWENDWVDVAGKRIFWVRV